MTTARSLLFPAAVASCAAMASALCGAARATENGLTHIDLGYFAILGGFGPPPGQPYLSADTLQVVTSRFNDRDGNPVKVRLGPSAEFPVKFLGNTTAEILNAAYVLPAPLPNTGIRVGAAAFAIFAGARTEAQVDIAGRVSGAGRSIGGVSDASFVPLFFQWNAPGALLHFIFAPTQFTAPTGSYNPSDPQGANVGTNYYSYRPALVATYLDPRGLELDLNLNGSVNSTNTATNYRSGSEISFTYAAIQHISPAFGAGLEGYYYKQVTGDTLRGVEVNTVRPTDPGIPFDPTNQGAGNKGQTFAIGPAFVFNSTPTVGANLRYQHEVFSDNRRQGDLIWGHVFAAF